MANKRRHLRDVVREICLGLPATEEFLSHGAPNYRIAKGRSFAALTVNHHGDGRIALWLAVGSAAQDYLVRVEPRHFFVPPYLGPRGWVGVRLDRGIDWSRVGQLAQDAWCQVAPARCKLQLGAPRSIEPPRSGLTLEELDPLLAPAARELRALMDDICLALPKTSRGEQFGNPAWCVGKKVFAQLQESGGRVFAAFRVGLAQQALLTLDPRFHVPAYYGPRGWVAFEARARTDRRRLTELAASSYQTLAPKR